MKFKEQSGLRLSVTRERIEDSTQTAAADSTFARIEGGTEVVI